MFCNLSAQHDASIDGKQTKCITRKRQRQQRRRRCSFCSLLMVVVLELLSSDYSCVGAFSPTCSTKQHRTLQQQQQKQPRNGCSAHRMTLVDGFAMEPMDAPLALAMLAFSSTHIGLSAARSTIIEALGGKADPLVGNDDWTLPPMVAQLGDGNDKIFPTREVAGRQLYRFLYTGVSFATLGCAVVLYLGATGHNHPAVTVPNALLYEATAVSASAASLASLVNASPLGLMPGFVTSQDSVPVLRRDDSLKFNVRGLTRITRHPLILPVVPWGIANAFLQGGHAADWIMFGGLSFYAVLGCAAQDLRVSRQEGSVGTTFDDFGSLQSFYNSTSLLPFGAVLQRKQSMRDIAREVPWVAFVLALPVAYWLETSLLEYLRG